MTLNNEKIAELENKGFKRWTKDNIDRLYIRAAQLGLVCTHYNTGNIHTAEFNGVSISNSQARRFINAETFIDVNTGKAYSDFDELAQAAAKLAGIAE